MASNDVKLYYDKWSTALQMAHQTKEDVYAGLTDTRAMESNRFFWKINGTVEMASLSTEDQEINHQARDYEERQMQASPAFLALKWEKGELLRAHASVKADWIQASIMAMHRWNAAVKRNAFTGNATAQYEGESTSSTKTLAGYSSDQVIAHGSAGLTEAKVKAIRSNFVKKKALQAGQQIYLAISQEEMDDLTALTDLRTDDIYNKGALESGKITGRVYGVNLIHDEDLNVSSSVRTCIAWVKSGLMFGEQAGVFTRQDELQTRHYMDQFYLRVDNGATRTRESDVMSVLTYHA
jgi:hypothetical protein